MKINKKFVDPNISRKNIFQNTHLDRVNSLDDGSPIFSEVEFSITGLCNRTCVFCPRVDPKMFPNVNKHLSLKFYTKILNDLKTINYSGRISFSGFGEPLLHPDLLNLVTKTKEVLPDSWLDIVSNGDRIDVKKMRELYNAGLSTLLISMYDGPEQIPVFEKMIFDSQIPEDWVILRKRYLPPEDGYGMNLTNRAGTVTVEESNVTMLSEPMQHPCFYTHYRMMIDYTGEVLLCSHDWGKKLIAGYLDKESLIKIWTGSILTDVRKRLGSGDRNHSPCNNCDVLGTRQGGNHFKAWKKHYENSNNK